MLAALALLALPLAQATPSSDTGREEPRDVEPAQHGLRPGRHVGDTHLARDLDGTAGVVDREALPVDR
jgi:hypothetical protein